MEKIQSIEQLDALGVKIYELLQVGIDKANIVVPETLQQIAAWALWGNTIESIICMFLIIISVIAAKRNFEAFSKPFAMENDFIEIMRGFLIGISILCCVFSFLHLVLHSGPALIKAIFAPNLVIIEQLGGLVK